MKRGQINEQQQQQQQQQQGAGKSSATAGKAVGELRAVSLWRASALPAVLRCGCISAAVQNCHSAALQ